jgi:hypothetical protein
MRLIGIIISALFVFFASAQDYSGYIVNAESGEPVPYANIGIINRGVGTVSDAEGWFEIELDSDFDRDTICISCIGYTDKKFPVEHFKHLTRRASNNNIKLSPLIYQLGEVIVKPKETRIYTLGNFCDSSSCYGNTFHSRQLGTEIGIIMELPRKKDQAFLKSLRFYVGECTYDSFPVRVNIYDLEDGFPGVNILREAIFVDITSPGEYLIPFSNYNITVEGDFFVSLEYYRAHKKEEGKLVFCAVHNRKKYKGNGLYRLTSHGTWTPEYGDNLGFSVEVECER